MARDVAMPGDPSVTVQTVYSIRAVYLKNGRYIISSLSKIDDKSELVASRLVQIAQGQQFANDGDVHYINNAPRSTRPDVQPVPDSQMN